MHVIVTPPCESRDYYYSPFSDEGTQPQVKQLAQDFTDTRAGLGVQDWNPCCLTAGHVFLGAFPGRNPSYMFAPLTLLLKLSIGTVTSLPEVVLCKVEGEGRDKGALDPALLLRHLEPRVGMLPGGQGGALELIWLEFYSQFRDWETERHRRESTK